MFGYLRPNREELKLKDHRKYMSYYCGLCNAIRRNYGIMWTLFLNYESAYLLLFLESYMKNDTEKIEFRCQMNPLKKVRVAIDTVNLDYVAFVNMLLLEMKLEDDELDEKKHIQKILKSFLNHKKQYKQMKDVHYDLVKDLKRQSRILIELEKAKGSIDSCADTTAEMLVAIIKYWYQINNADYVVEKSIVKLHYYIGKLIYILDAYEDFEKDRKKMQFNPMLYMDKEENYDKVIKKTRTIINLLNYCIKDRLTKIEFNTNKEIMQNVLTHGIEQAINRIEQRKRKCQKNR